MPRSMLELKSCSSKVVALMVVDDPAASMVAIALLLPCIVKVPALMTVVPIGSSDPLFVYEPAEIVPFERTELVPSTLSVPLAVPLVLETKMLELVLSESSKAPSVKVTVAACNETLPEGALAV